MATKKSVVEMSEAEFKNYLRNGSARRSLRSRLRLLDWAFAKAEDGETAAYMAALREEAEFELLRL